MEENTAVTEETTNPPVETTQDEIVSPTQALNEEPTSDTTTSQTVPISRLNDVIAKKNALQETVNTLQAQIDSNNGIGTKQAEQISNLNDTVADLKSQLAQANALLWKTQAGVKFGIPEEFVSRITGNTEEEIIADAEAMAKSFPTKRVVNVDNVTSANSPTVITTDRQKFIEAQYGVQLGE